MTPIQMICDRDRTHLLGDWRGIPAARLEAIIEGLGLGIAHENLGLREGALCMSRGLVLVNSRLPELCDARTDLHGVRNSILAHELGHWRLHRHLLERGQALSAVHEAQAYTYAEEFLLPRCQLRLRPQVWEMAGARKQIRRLSSEHLWRLCEELAGHFEVSRSSVAYRLHGLGLIHRVGGRLSLTRLPAAVAPVTPDTRTADAIGIPEGGARTQ